MGAGLGLMASQLSNVNMSSVPPERGSEVGGLQGTAQNLGASLGTALIGSILIAALVGNFTQNILLDLALAGVSNDIAIAAEANANFVTVEQVAAAAEAAGLPPEQVAATTAAYADAQIAALQAAFAGISPSRCWHCGMSVTSRPRKRKTNARRPRGPNRCPRQDRFL